MPAEEYLCRLAGCAAERREIADRISSEREVDNLPTCAVYSLQFEIAAWSELEWDTGVDAELDYPKRSG